jgi:hypothetical protein
MDAIAAKVGAGEPLAEDDLRALESERDIVRLGSLANTVRYKLHGSAATFVRVLDLELPSVKWQHDVPPAAGEVRLFQTPAGLDEAVAVVTEALELAGGTPLSAFCLFELSKMREGLPVVLPALKSAGLELITQAPLDRLRSPEHDLEAATDAGLKVARLTIDERPERNWTGVCRDAAALQRRLQSIRAFAPLPRKINETEPTTGYQDVRQVALARLLADNIETIQVDWALYGPKLAQVALTFGADDIDSVPAADDGAQGRRRSTVEEIRRNIRSAGFEPAERNARFEGRS